MEMHLDRGTSITTSTSWSDLPKYFPFHSVTNHAREELFSETELQRPSSRWLTTPRIQTLVPASLGCSQWGRLGRACSHVDLHEFARGRLLYAVRLASNR